MFCKKFTVLLALFLLTLFPGNYLSSRSGIKILIITADNKISISENNGKSWSLFNRGLPENAVPLRIYTAGRDMYLATFSSGLFRLNSDRWKSLNSQIFRRRSVYDKDPGYRKISAFAADPVDEKNIVIATKHSIYRSYDRGLNWTEVPVKGIGGRNYITALGVSGKKIYAGTSFNGVYELRKNSFAGSGKGLPSEPYSNTLSFVEQISFLAVNNKDVYAGFSFGGGLYIKKDGSGTYKPVVPSAENNMDSIIYDIKFSNNRLFFSDSSKIYSAHGDEKPLQYSKYDEVLEHLGARNDITSAAVIDETGSVPAIILKTGYPEKKKRSENSANKKTLYLSVPSLKNIDKHIKLIKNTEINAVVIDMKDDFGNIYFLSGSETAGEIKAQKKPVGIGSILKKLKANNIYTIARIVTFKDKKMFRAYNGKYAIKNKKTGKPWQGTENEFWVDPYSIFVHDYNIGLAVDLEKAGFDEIQFDYIRFP